jgi:hypothetical protein
MSKHEALKLLQHDSVNTPPCLARLDYLGRTETLISLLMRYAFRKTTKKGLGHFPENSEMQPGDTHI